MYFDIKEIFLEMQDLINLKNKNERDKNKKNTNILNFNQTILNEHLLFERFIKESWSFGQENKIVFI